MENISLSLVAIIALLAANSFFVMVALSLYLRETDRVSPFIWIFSLSLLLAVIAGKFFGALLPKENRFSRWMIGITKLGLFSPSLVE